MSTQQFPRHLLATQHTISMHPMMNIVHLAGISRGPHTLRYWRKIHISMAETYPMRHLCRMQKWNCLLSRKNISIDDIGKLTRNSTARRLIPWSSRPQCTVMMTVPMTGRYFMHHIVELGLLSHEDTLRRNLRVSSSSIARSAYDAQDSQAQSSMQKPPARTRCGDTPCVRMGRSGRY